MGLVPVQGDPFASGPAMPAPVASSSAPAAPASGSLVPVAHDPFASAAQAAPPPSAGPAAATAPPGSGGVDFGKLLGMPAGLGQMAANVPGSAANLVTSIAQPILHPVQTIQSFYDIGNGLVSKLQTATGQQQPDDQREAAANAVGSFFQNRYGSVENFQKTLTNDPVGVLADAATVLSGGEMAALRAAGTVGRVADVARAAGTVGRAIDPIAATGKGVTAVARGVGNAAALPLAVTTGVSPKVITAAGRAGLEGNQAFVGAMRGTADVNEPIAMAKRAVGQMGAERSVAYNADMSAVRRDQVALSWKQINSAVDAADTSTKFRGVAKSEEAAAVVDKMRSKVEAWQNAAVKDPAFQTAAGLDALKQAIGDTRMETEAGSLARTAADKVYNAIKQTIVDEAPGYAKTMADYSSASNKLNEIRKTFGLGERTTSDTALRKLQSLMRDNVNTNYGARAKLGDELARHEPDLPYALAGQAMSSALPRGLSRYLAGGEGLAMLASLFTNPATAAAGIPALLAMSPRLVGEAAYLGGRGLAGVNRGIGVVAPRLAPPAYQFGRLPLEYQPNG